MNDQPLNEDYGGPPLPLRKDMALRVLIWAFAAIVFCLTVGMSLDHPL